MQKQVKKLGFSKCLGGGLAEEVQKLETRVTEQERVFADKGLWELQLNGGKDGWNVKGAAEHLGQHHQGRDDRTKSLLFSMLKQLK